MGSHYEEEKERILEAVRHIMEHFEPYKIETDLNWPRCYRCRTEMCRVEERYKNSYYECMERDCHHREYNI